MLSSQDIMVPMNLHYRVAASSDKENVAMMTSRFIGDLALSGENVTHDDETVASVGAFVDRWIDDPETGTVVMAEDHDGPVALVAAGSTQPGIKTNHGKCAVAMIQYADPRYRGMGVVRDLHAIEQANLRSAGFDSIVCTVRYGDERHAEKMRRMGFSEQEIFMVRSL